MLESLLFYKNRVPVKSQLLKKKRYSILFYNSIVINFQFACGRTKCTCISNCMSSPLPCFSSKHQTSLVLVYCCPENVSISVVKAFHGMCTRHTSVSGAGQLFKNVLEIVWNFVYCFAVQFQRINFCCYLNCSFFLSGRLCKLLVSKEEY